MTHNFLISRLLSYGLGKKCYWSDKPITIKQVLKQLNTAPIQPNPETAPEPYSNTKKAREWHIGRILYFAENPNKIDAIDIDSWCYEGFIYPIPTVIDGNHRLMGAIIAELKTIPTKFVGIISLCDYLEGKTNHKPKQDK